MLWGSLWDPEDEVKKNVGAYVDEVSLQIRLSFTALRDCRLQDV
jgi:hypothetical protein